MLQQSDAPMSVDSQPMSVVTQPEEHLSLDPRLSLAESSVSNVSELSYWRILDNGLRTARSHLRSLTSKITYADGAENLRRPVPYLTGFNVNDGLSVSGDVSNVTDYTYALEAEEVPSFVGSGDPNPGLPGLPVLPSPTTRARLRSQEDRPLGPGSLSSESSSGLNLRLKGSQYDYGPLAKTRRRDLWLDRTPNTRRVTKFQLGKWKED